MSDISVNESISDSVDNYSEGSESQDFNTESEVSERESSPVNESRSAPSEGSEPVAEPQRFNIKVNGQDREVTLDELQRHYGLASAAQQRMSEAARIRQDHEKFIERLKTSPIEALKEINPDFDERSYAERVIEAQIEAEMLSPEQRRIRELEQSIRTQEEQRELEARQQQEAKYQQEVSAYREEYERTIINSLQGSGLPNTPGTVKKMAEYMSFSHQNGLGLTNEQMVEMVREDYVNDIKTLFSTMPGDNLLKLLGDEVANKIRKSDLARLRKGREATPPTTREVARNSSPAKARKALTPDEWREALDARLNDED